MPFTSFMSPDEDAAKVAPKEKVGQNGQMWVEKQQADDSFTMIPTYSYRYLYIFVGLNCSLRSWNMLDIVGISFLCLMSWSDLDGFVEQAGQQLWVCGSYTFKHFELSIYI